MLKEIKGLIELVSAALYALILPFVRKGLQRVVICYHGVKKAEILRFRKQIAYLSKECFVVKPSEIKDTNGDGSKVIVSITFDDAFLNVLENALPVLREYGLTAGISVPTGNLGRRADWDMAGDCPDQNEKIMSERQIAELDQEGFEILSHTVSHPVLTELDDSELEAELVGSKNKLEQIIGHEVSGISYPHGAYDARVYKATQKAGYILAFTLDLAMVDNTTDCLKIGRFKALPHESLIRFKLKVNGAYSVVRYLRSLKRKLMRTQVTDDLSICHTK